MLRNKLLRLWHSGLMLSHKQTCVSLLPNSRNIIEEEAEKHKNQRKACGIVLQFPLNLDIPWQREEVKSPVHNKVPETYKIHIAPPKDYINSNIFWEISGKRRLSDLSKPCRKLQGCSFFEMSSGAKVGFSVTWLLFTVHTPLFNLSKLTCLSSMTSVKSLAFVCHQ